MICIYILTIHCFYLNGLNQMYVFHSAAAPDETKNTGKPLNNLQLSSDHTIVL